MMTNDDYQHFVCIVAGDNPDELMKPYDRREKEEPYDPRVSKPFKLGYEEEIYNGINYGIPIQLYNQTWLTIDCKVDPDTHMPRVEIPPGWRIPTIDDYKKLIKWAKMLIFFNF